MKPYDQTQYAIGLIILMMSGTGLNFYILFFKVDHTSFIPFIFILVFFGIILLLFYRQRIRVFDDRIFLSFGIGLIWKVIDLKKIDKIEIVRLPFYYGRGIRITPKGTIYNLVSSWGIELYLINSRRTIRLGSKDPDQLRTQIRDRIRRIKKPNK